MKRRIEIHVETVVKPSAFCGRGAREDNFKQ